MSLRPLALSLCLLAPLAAEEPAERPGFGFSVHTAIGLGNLGRDVQDQLGFGVGLHAHVPVTERIALRPAFTWTGYRVNDRDTGWKIMAAILDTSYQEERLVLRSFQLGADLVGYRDGGCTGPYLFAGGGVQRAQLEMEHRLVDRSGNQTQEDTHTVAKWEPETSAYLQAGVGYQTTQYAFVEARITSWRYAAEPGTPLLDTPLAPRLGTRGALSLTLSAGVRF